MCGLYMVWFVYGVCGVPICVVWVKCGLCVVCLYNGVLYVCGVSE